MRALGGVGVPAAATLTLVFALAGCSGLGGGPALEAEPLGSASAAPSTAPGLARYYDQDVRWRDCRDSLQCATVEVPLDYSDPGGRAITLAVLKVPATDEDHRVGDLFVNPGGPGFSGVTWTAAAADSQFGEEIRAAFDLVGFDPRGVGASTSVDCVDDAEVDRIAGSDPDPDTRSERRESVALLRDLGNACLDQDADLIRHVSTEEVARDLDILRGALGQQRLAYFGASYGTLIGATYADLFPGRVGRMVLDGAVDPAAGTVETTVAQARGFETALRSYVAACVDQGGCYLGDSVDEGTTRVRDFLDELDAEPIKGDALSDLTEGWAVYGIWFPLYNKSYWPLLDSALSKALAGDGAALMALAEQYVTRTPDGYTENFAEVFNAVTCLDPHNDVTPAQAHRLEPRLLEASPTFGRVFAAGLTSCHWWPASGEAKPRALHARGAAPIMVVGTSRDPATPLRWAEALADQLESGVLVTRDGDGHTGYAAGNQCVDDTVEKYLVSAVVPKQQVDC